ncbi:hypothetical protein NYP20_11465 [Pseudomonas sp. N3-W]|jgi:hypothetical protein|uniref:Lipoprotein n=1 Tax=Pseudomonas fungipugnans TaxID=3024217 RepID=A0ABT6QWG6_9PSED|nr:MULTISPECIES: hypothetical protein [unclassified Pseudomonas]MDI2595255.1 hypothetical protein [Pseudomonas sp. 681]UWF51540.1 hypothetical protein NYP20_11465 [Pseudomonas sp. N3-W]
MKFILVMLLAITLCACATPVRNWSRPGTNASDLAQDKALCQYQAKAATASYHSTPEAHDKTHGMGSAVGDGIVIAQKQIDLTNDCMRVKGYVGQ